MFGIQEEFGDTKGVICIVYRRTDKTMTKQNKDKRTNNDLSSSCSTSGTRRVNLVDKS